MRVEVRYQTRGGNTKAAAEIIAEAFAVQAFPVEKPIEEYVDILFLGGGVYEWKMDRSLSTFIEQLQPQKIGQIVAFSTTGLMDSTVKQIRQAAERKGINVNENELLIKMMLRGHSMLGLKGGNLTKKQQEKILEFTDKIKGGL